MAIEQIDFMQVLESLPPDMDEWLDRAKSEMGGRVVFLDSPVSVERVEDPLSDETKANFGDFALRALQRRDLDDEHDRIETNGL